MPLKVIQGLCPDKSGKDENEKAAAVVLIFPFFAYAIWTRLFIFYNIIFFRNSPKYSHVLHARLFLQSLSK